MSVNTPTSDAPVEAPVEVPAVEDVTGKPDTPPAPKPKVDNTPLFKALVKAAKAAAGRGAEVVDKPSYVRVNVGGKTVAFVHNPTSKGVRVEVPKVDSGYDAVKVTSPDDATVVTDLVAALVTARKEAAAKAK